MRRKEVRGRGVEGGYGEGCGMRRKEVRGRGVRNEEEGG